MGAFGTGFAGNTAAATPSANQTAGGTNYSSLVNFAASQHIPDIYKQQIKRYGNRMLMGFLENVSAEESSISGQINWTEEGRLHIRATVRRVATTGATNNTFAVRNSANSGNATTHNIRVGQTLIISQGTLERKALVTTVNATTGVLTLASYTATASADGGFGAITTADATATVYGSEFAKGTTGMEGSLEREYLNRENNTTIKKDHYQINGSDATQVAWIETFSESGASNGFLWYSTSELDQRERFADYLELSCLEDVPAATSSNAAAQTGISGSRGLFYELEQYGNVFTGGFDDSSATSGRADFDRIVKQLDSQGAIMENMFYLDRDETLAIDNILAQQNSYGAGGTSWGMFNNSKDMGLNLGFESWKRGSYEFYKTDWKYLNDFVGRASHQSGANGNSIQGIMVPGGSMNVYDQALSATVRRPYLHIRYRQAGNENRKMKNWVTGSVGGVYTSSLDAMEVHYLSERCLVTQAANNFILLKQA